MDDDIDDDATNSIVVAFVVPPRYIFIPIGFRIVSRWRHLLNRMYKCRNYSIF